MKKSRNRRDLSAAVVPVLLLSIMVAFAGCSGVVTPPDTALSFGSQTLRDRTLISGRAMTELVLPEATGGNGALTYSLAPVVPGLVFTPGTRTLGGTPSTAGDYLVTYRVVDTDGDDAAITFTIRVLARTVGLLLNEPEAFEGYTLFKSGAPIHLIDNHGREVHRWKGLGYWGNPKLLESGHLMVQGQVQDGPAGGVQKIDWDGNVVWEYAFENQHHDFIYLPSGNVILLSHTTKTRQQVIALGANPDHVGPDGLNATHLVEVRPTGPTTGEIVWEWSAWDHLIQDFDPGRPNYGMVARHPELIDLNYALSILIDWRDPPDWMHTNAIAYNPEIDQIVLSPRHFSELWIIDHSTTTEQAAGHTGGNSGRGGDLLYRWGNPRTYRAGTVRDQQLFFQHDTHWIAPGLPGAGNILVFNNGLEFEGFRRLYSSADEIVPPVDGYGYRLDPGSAYGPSRPVWTYAAGTRENFYSHIISSMQRLPSGNTLIVHGTHGTLFEVTPAGKTVWKYINPVISTGPLQQGDTVPVWITVAGAEVLENRVYRAYRYAPDYPGLQGRDLTPGDPIER